MSIAVSIVIPLFNRDYALAPCIAALAKQTYVDFEIVMVDDGSTDDSAARIVELQAQYPSLRMCCYRFDENRGANVARNEGVRKANGELICFIDSDCIPEPEWLAALVGNFGDPSVVLVTGRVDDTASSNIYERVIRGTCRVYERRGYAQRIVSSNVCVRKELLLKYPLPEDVKYGCNEESLYLFLKVAGYCQRYDESARVKHHHPYTFETFIKRAYGLGCAAAWLVYKYYLLPRKDLLPFVGLYICLLLTVLNVYMWWGVVVCASVACSALAYNEHILKKKSLKETFSIFPMLLVYYHVRLWGYVSESCKLYFFPNDIKRVNIRGVVSLHEDRKAN